VLQEANKTNLDFDALDRIVRQDVALSMKLLRYINSAMFSLRSKVESIKQALVLLGPNLLRKWISLLAIASMADDRPGELVVSALVRARFCELLGEKGGARFPTSDLFLAGMLSFMDAILGRPMSEIISDLPLSSAVRDALQGQSVGLGKVLRLVQAYEQADWSKVASLRGGLSADDGMLGALYQESVEWTNQIYQVGKA
jgi:EAL and modified HD-GYP domain-containing signal transduction protein